MTYVTGMRIAERLGLAHLAYRRAVLRARAESTPASWRQLVAAGRNLRGAERERQRGGRRAGPPPDAGAAAGVLVRLPHPGRPRGANPPGR